MHCWSVAAAIVSGYVLIMLLMSYSFPFSQVFRQLHSYDELFHQVEKASDLRSEKAKQYFKNVSPTESSKLYRDRLGQKNITFVIGIITVQRMKDNQAHNSYHYLLQSASLLDQILKRSAFFNSSVPFICNVDAFPQKHVDAVSLYQFLPYVERYGVNSTGIPAINIPESNTSFREHNVHKSKYQKETFDYAFCLLAAAALNPEYVILLEDDALPHSDFPAVLEHLLQTRLKMTHEHSHNNRFAFLKLYFPAKWQGFAFELSKCLDLVSWSVVGGSVLSVIYHCYSVRQKIVSYHTTRIFLAGSLLTMISCWLIGRQNVNELRRISKHFYRLQSSEGCCTQAMMYPMYIVDAITHYLTSGASDQHTDLAILDFSDISRLHTYQIEPSLFFHVGLHTTLNLGQKHPEEFILNL